MLLSKNIKYQQYITDKANLQGITANWKSSQKQRQLTEQQDILEKKQY